MGGWQLRRNDMSESLADKFVYVANEIARMDDDVDNENPHRYPLRKMKQVAEKILLDALGQAQQVADTARVLKKEICALDARNQP